MNPALILEFTRLGIDLANSLIVSRRGVDSIENMTAEEILAEIQKIREELTSAANEFDLALGTKPTHPH